MKKGLTTAQIVMLVVVAIVILPILGFIGLIVLYAMMHNPPRNDHAAYPDAAANDAAIIEPAPPAPR